VSGRRTNPAFPVDPEPTPSARRLVPVAEVSLQADLGARPDDADGAHEAAAGRRLLRTEHMLDAGADAALHAVRRCLGFRQRMTTRRAYMNAATEALCLQPRLRRLLAKGATACRSGKRSASCAWGSCTRS
jgi:hypothetical protein